MDRIAAGLLLIAFVGLIISPTGPSRMFKKPPSKKHVAAGQPAITFKQLKKVAPYGNEKILTEIARNSKLLVNQCNLTTPLLKAHFIAQAAHESAGFRTLTEYGKQSYFKKYERGRLARLLGNRKGDGARYRGRGIFQLTGRWNYAYYSKITKLPLVSRPEIAATPVNSIKIACAYWNEPKSVRHRKTGKILKLSPSTTARRDNLKMTTLLINGGQNGLRDRKLYLARAKSVFGVGTAVHAAFIHLPDDYDILEEALIFIQERNDLYEDG